MSEELDDLKQSYKQIEAPPFLATRVRASVADESKRRHTWLPVAAATAVAAAAIWVLPLGEQSTPDAPTRPSLSTIASLKIQKPAGVAPSLSQIKSVSIPEMPSKPVLKPGKPQTNSILELLKEKDHADV